MRVLLASASPRRSSILREAGISFGVVVAEVMEAPVASMPPSALVLHNAGLKAKHVAAGYPDSIVLGADTIVALRGMVFGKPATHAEARAMLGTLSGETHEVLTGVHLALPGNPDALSFVERTRVRFHPIDDAGIDRYLLRVNPLDKAGAYALQEDGGELVAEISGCPLNVIGLPLPRILEKARTLGISLGAGA